MIQLEVGKRYVRRDGWVTDPLRHKGPYTSHPFTDGMYTWRYDGLFGTREPYCLDLIAEYAADYDHLGDLQREHNEMQNRDEKEQACWEALSGMVSDNQAMGMYDPPQPAIRTFASGATRNLDHNKLDYEGFNCPAAQRAFAEYMHTHRKQADGTMRDGDNWQKGIPIDQYMKSIKRHTQDLHLLYDGWTVVRPEDDHTMTGATDDKIELLCAIWFNVQGMIHELLKEERSMSDRPPMTPDKLYVMGLNDVIDSGFADYATDALKTACVRCEIRKTCDCAFDSYNIDVEPGIDCLAAK